MAEPARQLSSDATGVDHARDTQLVLRVLGGDAEAYGELVGRHMRTAFAVAYRILEHREDSEDVVQESFMRALERIHTMDPARPFRPWFFRIVVNQALNARRSRSVRVTDQLPDDVAAQGVSPAQATENAMVGERLRAALAALPERQRTIVQLAELEELNSSEIADILDVSPGTVRWHLHQARQTLRAVLEPLKEER